MNPLNKLPHDKALHVIVGVLAYAAFHFVSPLVGLVAVAIAAVGKEIYDYMHRDKHTPDVWDAVATMGGGLLAFISGVKL
jgi:hypothetical protein